MGEGKGAFEGINDDELDGDADGEFSYELSVLSNETFAKASLLPTAFPFPLPSPCRPSIT